MIKKYIKPELEIYEFDTEDEITTSNIYENGTNNAYSDYLTNDQQGTSNMYGTEFFNDANIWQDN